VDWNSLRRRNVIVLHGTLALTGLIMVKGVRGGTSNPLTFIKIIHKTSVCASQRTQCMFITNTYRLVIFKENRCLL
jgi:hypothetical protein